MQDILFAFWFLLPAALANGAPVFSNVIPGLKHWNTRMDGDRTFRGKEIFGAHKTWRGLVCGVVVATITFWIQQLCVEHFAWAQQIVGNIPYAQLPTLLLGALFGVGALGGDAVESFFKRQKGVPSGGTWIPFDQLDYIIGAVLVSLPFIILSPIQYLWIFVVWFALHVTASYAGWLMGLKKDPI